MHDNRLFAVLYLAECLDTVYKDLTERLPHLDGRLYRRIRHVLDCNKAERHLRGGRATQEKFRGEKLEKITRK